MPKTVTLNSNSRKAIWEAANLIREAGTLRVIHEGPYRYYGELVKVGREDGSFLYHETVEL